MAFAQSEDQIDLVATVLSALENAPTTARFAPLSVTARDAEPQTLVGAFVAGKRYLLTPDDVRLTVRILLGSQPFAGCNAIADGLISRLAQAELLTFRANTVRMLTPMGRG